EVRSPSDIGRASARHPRRRVLKHALLRWYDRHRRDLPWRAAPPNSYHVLVSEFMLQQTQVATVIPYFARFTQEFPTLVDLASATEQQVLRLWQGLGYYSRARNLHAAAKAIVADHKSQIPSDVQTLLSLPGIGRYTAGAIASIAFGKQAPLLDGNVARVLCRLYAIEDDPRHPKTTRRLWQLAESLVAADRPGDFNVAMMELGATVCTPRNPACDRCPLQSSCVAYRTQKQQTIPPPRRRPPTPLEKRWAFAMRRGHRWLIEQRPATGRWAGLWQFVTVEANGRKPQYADLRRIGSVAHTLSHRRYRFDVFTCTGDMPPASDGRKRKWVTLGRLDHYPMSKPQLTIAKMIATQADAHSSKPPRPKARL
ncbi:MAG TPA: A/G-specific adenine glycosylase, partial [Tepidisphaeraceae bacterium]|nr:A/G-specific adenine glycosylase [Tepidisphaeraceae bacterium]